MLRNADAIVYCRAARRAAGEPRRIVRARSPPPGIEKRAALALTKADDLPEEDAARAVAVARSGSPVGLDAVVPVSVLDDESLDRLREAVWALTGLIRVRPRRDGRIDDEPFALGRGRDGRRASPT